MNDDPNIDELKEEERIKIEIPVDEEPATRSESTGSDVVGEFMRMGKSLAGSLEAMLTSSESRRIGSEVREGVKGFAGEMETFFREAVDSPAGERLKKDAKGFSKRVESSDTTRQAQEGIVTGLRRLSEEMDKLAARFDAEMATADSDDDDSAA